MKTYIYFNNEAEVLEYGKKNNIEYMENGVNNAREEWGEYYEPFRNLEGCEVLFVLPSDEPWHKLRMCIRWKGVTMTNRNDYTRGDKTQALRLVERLDSMGLTITEGDGDCPLQKIGKPTAKKLDEWRNWLLGMRKHDEERRDRIFAEMLAKIDECCKQFPEAKAVKWEKGYWTFEKTKNGINYVLQINSNGNIYEKYDLSYKMGEYPLSPADIAARLMANGLEGVKMSKDFYESGKERASAWSEQVNKFVGGRPF